MESDPIDFANEFGQYSAKRGAAEANRNLNGGFMAPGTYCDGARQARTVSQFKGFSVVNNVLGAGASGFLAGAYGYCAVNCLAK